ncbi:c-type cytochrome [Vibrio mediterranei]
MFTHHSTTKLVFLLALSTGISSLAYSAPDSATLDIIDARQKAFTALESQTKAVKKTLDGSDTDWQTLLEASEQLVANSDALNGAFVLGTQEGSKAKESVWSKPEKFNRLMQQMQQGYQQVALGAQNQSIAEVEKGLKAAEFTCKSCHRSYRSRW